MINFLYDLTAVQPSPQSKFHGGGEYGEVVFFKLLENLDKIHLAAYYNSSAYLNPDILKAIDNVDKETVKSVIDKIFNVDKIGVCIVGRDVEEQKL